MSRSAIIPGTGHLAVGRRRTGWVLFAVALVVLGAMLTADAAVVLAPATVVSSTVRPGWLTTLRFGVPDVAAAWVAVLVRCAVLIRPGRRGGRWRLAAGGLTTVLVAAIAVPAGPVSHHAGVQRRFVLDVPLGNGRLDVLLVGSAARPDRTGTVVLASLDTRTDRTVLFTRPRNLERVPFAPGSAMSRKFPRGLVGSANYLLNTVFGYGVDHPPLFPGDRDPGMAALTSVLTATLGLPAGWTG